MSLRSWLRSLIGRDGPSSTVFDEPSLCPNCDTRLDDDLRGMWPGALVEPDTFVFEFECPTCEVRSAWIAPATGLRNREIVDWGGKPTLMAVQEDYPGRGEWPPIVPTRELTEELTVGGENTTMSDLGLDHKVDGVGYRLAPDPVTGDVPCRRTGSIRVFTRAGTVMMTEATDGLAEGVTIEEHGGELLAVPVEEGEDDD